MKTPRFGANPDHCRAGNFEAGCQRWNIPTYCVQYCTNCCKLLVKELKHQIWFSLQTECCKIWWKNWNTRYNFPFRQNAAKFGERIETPDTVSLQTECCTGKFSPSMLELWAPAGQLRKKQITERYTILNTTLSPLQSLCSKTGSCLWCITVQLTSLLRFE